MAARNVPVKTVATHHWHGIRPGDIVNMNVPGLSKQSYRAVIVGANTMQLRPLRWYERVWMRLRRAARNVISYIRRKA